MKAHVFFLLLSLSSFTLFSQINISKYASEELFSSKPIITEDYIEKIEQEKSVENYIEIDIQKGIELWNSGEADDAIQHFESLFNQYHLFIAKYYNGLIEFGRSNYGEARFYFQETLDEEPLFLEAKYMLGMVDLYEDDFSSAKKHFKTIEKVDDYKALAYNGLGYLHLRNGNPYAALSFFNKCIKANPTFQDSYIPLVNLNFLFGNYKKARSLIEQALTYYENWQQGIMIRAILALLADEDMDQFERDIDHLLELDPKNYHFYSIKGFLNVELGLYSEAVAMFHYAYNLELDTVQTGEYKFNSKMEREASIKRALNYYFENTPKNDTVKNLIERGICELMIENKNESILYLDSANSIEKSAPSYLFQGSIYRSKFGQESKAIESYSSAIRLDSTNWISFYHRGELLLKTGKHQEAFDDFSTMIKLQPNMKFGYKNRGNILLEYGYFQLAYRDYSYAISIDPTDYDSFFNRSISAKELGYHRDAINDLKFVVAAKKRDGEAYYEIYENYFLSGDSTAALQNLDSASKYSKYNKKYHEDLYEFARSVNNKELMLNALNRLVRYFSNEPEYRLKRARFYFEEKKYYLLAEDIRQLHKRNKESGESYYMLSKALSNIEGNDKNAKKYLLKSQKLGYRPERN
jgi:tetratricopeptide (TPR) repeat protein